MTAPGRAGPGGGGQRGRAPCRAAAGRQQRQPAVAAGPGAQRRLRHRRVRPPGTAGTDSDTPGGSQNQILLATQQIRRWILRTFPKIALLRPRHPVSCSDRPRSLVLLQEHWAKP